MLNEEKIRLMTKAATYEKQEGKKTIPVNHYFKGDYISINLIWCAISYTLVYLLCVGLWGFYKMEYLMANIHMMNLPAFGKKLITIYGVGLAVYLVLALLYYYRKYKKSRKSLAGYYQILKRISAIYGAEEKAKRTTGGEVRHDDVTGV